jgi:hypothetical protein
MYTNRMAVARRYGKSHRASRLFGEAEGFNIPYDAERIHGISQVAPMVFRWQKFWRNSISH